MDELTALLCGLLADFLSEAGIWTADAISNVAGAVVVSAWYRRGTWREKRLVDAD